MKYLQLFTFLLLSYINCIAQSLEQVYPSYDVSHLEYFDMNDNGIGYAIGQCDVFYVSVDGGENWEIKQLPAETNFNSKVLNLSGNLNSEVIYLTNSKLFISKDYGDNWDVINTNIDPAKTGSYASMEIASNGDILVNTFKGLVLKSRDKGNTWTSIDVGAMARLKQLSVVKGGHVWACDSKSTIYHSQDDGDTWATTYTHKERILKLQFISEKVGFLVDLKSKMYKTTDGGKNWSPHMEDATLITSQMFIRSENEYWFNNNLAIYITPDAGSNWVNSSPQKNFDVFSRYIHFHGNEVWVIGSNNVIMRTLDNGLTWTLMNGLNPYDLNSAIADQDEIIAVGNNGYLLSSEDGGVSWKQENIGSIKINDIEKMDSQSLILATQGGLKQFKMGGALESTNVTSAIIVLKTDPISKRMLALSQRSPCELWGSDDRGATWEKIKEFPFSGRQLMILSKTNYLILGGRTDLMGTLDGGETWTKIEVPNASYISDISGYEENKLLVLNAGMLTFSDDFGKTFSKTFSVPRVATIKMRFLDSKIGYILGDKGFESELYETTDGGEKWHLISRLCSRGKKIILNPERNTMWIPAQGGSIYRLEDHRIGTIAIPHSNIKELTAFPNPSSGAFSLLDTENTITDARLVLYNIYGNVVWRQAHYSFRHQINLMSDNLHGMYLLEIKTNDHKIYHTKIIIE